MLDPIKRFTLIFLFFNPAFTQIHSQESFNIFLLSKSYKDGIPTYQHEITTPNSFHNFDKKQLTINLNSESLLDSIITISSNGIPSYKCTYDYDVAQRASNLNIDLWLFDHWEKDWLFTFNYDSIGNLITVLHESWNGREWDYFGRETFIYDLNNRRLSGLFERWEDNLWVNEFRYNYSYDLKGNLVHNLFEYWSNDTWIVISRQTNSYGMEGYQTSYLYQLWESNNWKDNRQGFYEYDFDGKLIFNTVKNWDGVKWVNYSRVTYNYDLNGNRELNLIEMWDGSQWVNSNKISYNYNADNYLTYGLYEIWKNGGWVRGDGGISIENPPGYRLGFITCEMFAYYSSPTDVKEEEFLTNNYELFNNYPNPFNPTTKIKYTVPASLNPSKGGTLITLKVFNILGNEIATLVNEEKSPGTYEVEFSARGSALSSGVYFYTLSEGEFSQTKKMILAK